MMKVKVKWSTSQLKSSLVVKFASWLKLAFVDRSALELKLALLVRSV